MWRIGIDLGGSKIEGIILNPRGEEVRRRRVATPAGRYQATIEAIADLVLDLGALAKNRDFTLGIGTPGSISPASGLMRNCNATVLNGKNLQGDLEARLGMPVAMANDANCFTLSEATDGAGANARSVFGVILGTGVGGGLVFENRLQQGHNQIAGEWGHNSLPWAGLQELPGPACFCGKTGCIETWLSGPGLLADYRRLGGKPLDRVEMLIDRLAFDPIANQALKKYENRLARSLSMLINMVDPEVIVLGGGLSNIARLYEQVPLLWLQWVFAENITTKLVPALYGDSSGVRGAAWLTSRRPPETR